MHSPGENLPEIFRNFLSIFPNEFFLFVCFSFLRWYLIFIKWRILICQVVFDKCRQYWMIYLSLFLKFSWKILQIILLFADVNGPFEPVFWNSDISWNWPYKPSSFWSLTVRVNYRSFSWKRTFIVSARNENPHPDNFWWWQWFQMFFTESFIHVIPSNIKTDLPRTPSDISPCLIIVPEFVLPSGIHNFQSC